MTPSINRLDVWIANYNHYQISCRHNLLFIWLLLVALAIVKYWLFSCFSRPFLSIEFFFYSNTLFNRDKLVISYSFSLPFIFAEEHEYTLSFFFSFVLSMIKKRKQRKEYPLTLCVFIDL